MGLFAALIMCLCLFVGMSVSSCKSKTDADQEIVDSLLAEAETISVDTLVYHVEEEEPNASVDENFNDFIYTFTHNNKFRYSRVQFPLLVKDENAVTVRRVKNQNELNSEFSPSDNDYYVLLLHSIDELENDLAGIVDRATLHLADMSSKKVRRFNYARKDGLWSMNGAEELSFEKHPFGSFLDFYDKFSGDSLFRVEHIAQQLSISLPDDEDGTMIDGTIDADQFPVFAPEMPSGRFMIMDYSHSPVNDERVVMVKCGMASGMMDVLTFEKDGEDWKLKELGL